MAVASLSSVLAARVPSRHSPATAAGPLREISSAVPTSAAAALAVASRNSGQPGESASREPARTAARYPAATVPMSQSPLPCNHAVWCPRAVLHLSPSGPGKDVEVPTATPACSWRNRTPTAISTSFGDSVNTRCNRNIRLSEGRPNGVRTQAAGRPRQQGVARGIARPIAARMVLGEPGDRQPLVPRLACAGMR